MTLHSLARDAAILYEEAIARWTVRETHGPSLLTYNPPLEPRNVNAPHCTAEVRQEWVPRNEVDRFVRIQAMSDMLFELGVDEPYAGRIERKI